MKYLFALIGYLILHFEGFSQNDSINPINDSMNVSKIDSVEPIFTVEKPSFPGGDEALYRYIGENVNYPAIAFENDIQCKVIVEFIVRPDGSISDIHTLGDKIGYGLEEEAMRVVANMPLWNPGMQRGKAVSVKFRLPIKFNIENSSKKNKKRSLPPPPPPPQIKNKGKPND